MLEKIANLPPGIVGVKAVGRISRADYESVIEPIFEEARNKGDKIRFLYELGPDFDSGDFPLGPCPKSR